MMHSALDICVAVAAGLAVGTSHFALLWWNTRLFTNGEIGKAAVLQLARMATVGVVLAFLARSGALALLSGALGFLAARVPLLPRLGGL